MTAFPGLVVPDASVILKWVLPPEDEPFWPEARALLEAWRGRETLLRVPGFWRYEVANVLSIKAAGAARELLEVLLLLGLQEVGHEDSVLRRAMQIVKEVGKVSVYDAAYHAAALLIRGQLVTADEHYFHRARRLGSIRLLGRA